MQNSVHIHQRTLGVIPGANGTTQVTLWAPNAKSVTLLLNGKTTLPLSAGAMGYWQTATSQLQPGDTYQFIMDDAIPLPDPASVSQPGGVHGPSEVLNLQQFGWTDSQWSNPPQEQYIIYELHTGTFSNEGNFEGIEKKLDYLKNLGITAIEIMPVAQFSGRRNWGYDGVFPFCVQNNYGGAKGLQQLVNACHQKKIAVVLDVVYNHLGPEGNYLGAYGAYFTGKYQTPWGKAMNFDDAESDAVRRYFIENALMWFRDFHIDALRLDAVHAIKDFGAVHFLKELRLHVDALVRQTGRGHYLIAESDLNDPKYINATEQHGYGMHAQWVDEFHHALRVAAGEPRRGYYADFDGVCSLAKAYQHAYVFDGQYSAHRKKTFGAPTQNEGRQFVVFSQNHDQVGNRMLGERTSTLVSFEMQKLLAAAVFISPYIPLIFMGEEWSETNPFLYFVDHSDAQLAEAVRKGRNEEFAAFHLPGQAPDPFAKATFLNAKLQWHLLQQPPHETMHAYYKALITLRKTHPVFCHLTRKNVSAGCNSPQKLVWVERWHENNRVLCLLNFSKEQQMFQVPQNIRGGWVCVLDSAAAKWLGPKPRNYAQPQDEPTVFIAPESILIMEAAT